MFVFIEDKNTYDNFNHPLAIKIDLEQLLSSIKWISHTNCEFAQIEKTIEYLTYKDLIFSLFNSLEGSLVIFNKSIITLSEQFKVADVNMDNLPFNTYEISSHTTDANINIIDLPSFTKLIKKHFNY